MADSTQAKSPAQGDQGEVDAPNYVTADQFNEQVNRAISARLNDFQKKFEKSMGETMGGLMKHHFDEYMKATTPTTPSPAQASEDSPVVKGLQKQLAEFQTKLDKAQAERDSERAKAADVALRQQLSDALVKNGIDASRARHAIGLLVDAEKRVRWGEDGESIVFKDIDGVDVDLQTGLKSWAKTEDAKIYMPPRGASGSGDRPVSAKTTGASAKGIQSGDLGKALLEAFGPKL